MFPSVIAERLWHRLTFLNPRLAPQLEQAEKTLAWADQQRREQQRQEREHLRQLQDQRIHPGADMPAPQASVPSLHTPATAPATHKSGRKLKYQTAQHCRNDMIDHCTKVRDNDQEPTQENVAADMCISVACLNYHHKKWRKEDPHGLPWKEIVTDSKT
jgi:hypothetical protein